MLRFATVILVGAGLTCVPVFGSLTFVTTQAALSGNASVNWSQFGGDSTPLANNSVANATPAGITVTTTFETAPNDGEIVDAGSSWTSGGGFNAGDALIWAYDQGASTGTGPLQFLLSAGVNGLGAYVQADTPTGIQTCTGGCGFTVNLSVYDTTLTLLGSHSYASDAAGDPVFVGAINSPLAATIGEIVISLTACPSCNDNTGDLHDFAVDSLILNEASATPEPTTYLLLGTGLAAIALIRNRKNNRRNW